MIKASAELIGHQEILRYLEQSLQNNSLAHAYLFLGPAGSGRMKLLEVFLPQIIQSKNLQHPDIRVVTAESDTITISQIRELRAALALSGLAGSKKIAVIDGAEKMNTEAQNAFLKVLEEPVKNTYIFLLASHRRTLLPTIYSRVVPIYFNPVPTKEMEALAVKLGLESSAVLESHGCPGYLINKSQGQENDSSLIDGIISKPDPSERLRFFMQAKMEKEAIRPWLQSLAPVLRERLLALNQPIKLVKTIKLLQEALSGPTGQNWQLIAENVIISI